MALLDRQRDNARRLIAVQLQDFFSHILEQVTPGLHDNGDFRRAFDLTLPLIDRLMRRHDIRAGNEALLDQRGGDLPGFLAVRARDINE